MKSNCLKIGDPDKAGNREYTFMVTVDRRPVVYQVTARSTDEAQERLRGYVQADAVAVQELGAGGGIATLIVIGTITYGVYVIAKHIKRLIPAHSAKRPSLGGEGISGSGDGVKPKAAAAGRGYKPPTNTRARAQAKAAPARAANPAQARAANPAQARAANPARRAPIVNGATDGAPDDDEAAVSPRATPFRRASPTWRPVNYNGAQGQLAGGDPTTSLRVLVFSDAPVDPFLSLVRPSSYDSARSRFSDAIVVMSFPAADGSKMRPAPDSLEVMVGDANAARGFDIIAPTVEQALEQVRTRLAAHL